MAGGGEGDDRGSRGGGGEEPEERTDGWMATYSDMVTLLMCFFVLMFAISNVDSEKAALMFAAFSRDGLSIDQYLEIAQPFEISQDPWDESFGYVKEEEPSPSDSGPGDMVSPELESLYNKIGFYIDEKGLGDKLHLVFNGEYLLLTLANDIWFESAETAISPAMKENARVIAGLLAETWNDDNPFEIVVTGHTDNVPIHTVQYPSNWYVSSARATNYIAILIADSGLDPFYFRISSMGEEHPIADNDTPEGRQANRRVEVQITLAKEDTVRAAQRRAAEA